MQETTQNMKPQLPQAEDWATPCPARRKIEAILIEMWRTSCTCNREWSSSLAKFLNHQENPALPLPNATWIAYFSGFHCLLLQLLRLIWSFSMNIMLYVLHWTSRCHATPQNSSVWCKQSNSATLLFLFSQSTSKLNSWIRIYYNVTRAKTKMQWHTTELCQNHPAQQPYRLG